MNILFLGPTCPRIENLLRALGHFVHREEGRLSSDFSKNNFFNFCISYRYHYILTPSIIHAFQNGLINMHISLLPWNRGSDPNLWSFLENTPKGVTIHHTDETLDTGAIILQQSVYFDETKETLRTTYSKLSNAVESLFTDHVESILNRVLPYHPQPSGGSFHRSRDKIPFLPLLKEKGWDTPVGVLTGAGLGCAPRQPATSDKKVVSSLFDELPRRASSSKSKSTEKLSEHNFSDHSVF